jgi:hypothetical protein
LNAPEYVAGDFDVFLRRLRQNGEWAGHLELDAFILVLNRPIVVLYQDGQDPHVFSNPNCRESMPIFVKYNGVNHYDAVVFSSDEEARREFEKISPREGLALTG